MPEANAYAVPLEDGALTLRLSHQADRVRYRWDTDRHCNAGYELHILLSGQCRLEVENDVHLLTAGQAIIIAPGQYHYPRVQSGPFERFALSFYPAEGNMNDRLCRAVPVAAVFCAPEEMLHLCRFIHLQRGLRAPHRQEMIASLLSALMILVLRQILPGAAPVDRPAVPESVRSDLIDQYFTDHFAEPGGEEALAALLHLSRRQLARVLNAQYGMGFRQKLIRTRMDRAAWLLRTSDKRVGEIAALTGYASESAFHQVFRKEFHMTPRQYRERH